MRSIVAGWPGGVRLLAAACGLVLAGTAAGQEPARRFEVEIKAGEVARAQRVLKAIQHERLRLVWSVDTPQVIHLEGYDISVTARPGQPQIMEFTARAAGRFPVHAHAADAVRQGQAHSHGRGVLLRLEVHPK